MTTALSPELERMRQEIRGYAVEAGLDFFEVMFEVLDWNQINAVAAYGGFPNRYPHWRFGMEYEHLSKSYAYGLSKIYEMVINNDPSYAYLLHSNNVVDQKMVMAHVYGHSDFFKNNLYFSQTNRKMIDEMGNHRSKILNIVERLGQDKVEDFIDRCLSLENLIDYRQVGLKVPRVEAEDEMESDLDLDVRRLPSKEYMEKYVNPKSFLDSQKKKLEEQRESSKKFPEHAERDILLFLCEFAPLERWERDVLSILREESYYFAPQGLTKIMNEGWASYHHSRLMTTRILKDSEVIDYADHHSGTVSPHPGQLNPYKLGMELFRDIEDRWNKGKFGSEYERCEDFQEKRLWDKKLGLGKQKVFEVRKLYNDLTFLDAFMDADFCRDQKMFHYGYNAASGNYEIIDREFRGVKDKLLQRRANMGSPQVAVIDANAFNRGELTIKHFHDGSDLKKDWAWETLKNLQFLWRRPVHLETMVDGTAKVLTFDGSEQKEQKMEVAR